MVSADLWIFSFLSCLTLGERTQSTKATPPKTSAKPSRQTRVDLEKVFFLTRTHKYMWRSWGAHIFIIFTLSSKNFFFIPTKTTPVLSFGSRNGDATHCGLTEIVMWCLRFDVFDAQN